MKRRQVAKKLCIGAFVLVLAVLAGPSAIHACYRRTTSAAVIASNRAAYQRLANDELGLPGEARQASVRRRMKLYAWFHARGLNIDEDDEPRSVWHPWHELVEYWRQDGVE